MKKIYLLLVTVLCAVFSFAQSSTNYAFTTNNTGSLSADMNSNAIDMSTGTTQLVGAGLDAAASPVTNIGFDYYLMGTRFTQFSVNEDGVLQLGGTVVGTNIYTISGGTTALPRLGAFNSDMRTGTTSGKIHYKLVGAAPNRTLIIEFKDMQLFYTATAAAGTSTFQMRLYESTNAIEYVYGTMSATDVATGNRAANIGFYTGSATGAFASVLYAGHTNSTTSPFTANPNVAATGAITELTSAADGNRRYYRYVPSAPVAPTALSFTGLNAFGMTLNWTDNSSDELGFVIFRSTDNVNFTYITQTAANATSSIQGGLTQTTIYYWRVYALREITSTVLSGSQTTTVPGNITATGSGNWSSTTPGAPWPGGIVPTAGDNVTIPDGSTITIDIPTATCFSLQVGQGASGTLQYIATPTAGLTVGSNLLISPNGTLTAGAGALTTHTLSVAGNLTNNGTLDLSTATAGVALTFTGAANNAFGGSGPVTDVRTITINKGTSSANVLELNPTNFTVQGTNVDGAPMSYLTITNGTFKVSGTFTMDSRTFATAGYTIPATGGFWLNNANYSVTGQTGSSTLAGLFRITQGTFNIGTATGNSMAFNAGSTVIVEGGAVNAAGRFGVTAAATAFNYTQSAGTITVCTQGNTSTTLGSFDLGTSLTSVITITGGTIVTQLSATTIDYRDQGGSGILGLTGGTLQLGNAASGAAKTFNIRGVAPNVVVSNISAGHTAAWSTTITNYNNICLNVTINTGATLNFANAVFLFNGSSITNNGTIIHNGASSRFITFSPATNISYSGTGTVTAPMTSLELQNDLNFTISPASSNIAATRIIIFSGSFVNANKLTLGNGAATTGTIQIGNTTTPTGGGTFDVAPTFNLGTGGEVISYLRTNNTKIAGPEINPTRILTSMTYDDNDLTHTLAIAGGDLTLSSTGTALTLANGRVVTPNSIIIASSAATVSRTAGYVDGTLKKTLAAAGAKTFEVGTVSGYSPVAFSNTAGTFPADISVKPTGVANPAVNPSTSLQKYWTITAPTLTSADLAFTYPVADVAGTEASYQVIRVTGGTPTVIGGTVNTTTHVASVTGVTSFTDFTVGEPAVNPCTGAVGGTATGSANYCGSGTPTITATGYSTGLGGTYQWQRSATLAFTTPIDIAGQTNAATLTTGVVSTTTYYRLKVTCPSGTATAFSNVISVIVNPSAAVITPTPSATICLGQSVTLNETGGTGTSWLWSPGGATTQSITVSPTTTTVYTVTVNSAGGCVATASRTITVNPVPTTVTASASANTICTGTAINLFSSAATPPSNNIFTQDFESGFGSPYGTWTTTNGTSGGTAPATVVWTIRNHGYANATPTTFNSPGGTQFALIDADGGGSGTVALSTLVSPTFSTVGYSALTLTYRDHYRALTAPEAFVEVSTNGGTSWTIVKQYTATVNTSTAFGAETVDLSAYAGNGAVNIRFRYQAGWAYYWAVDDIALNGTVAPYTYSWTSTPAGYTSTAQNPTGVTPTVTTTYTVSVSGLGGCATTASTTVIISTPTAQTVTGGGAFCSGGTGLPIGLAGSQTGVNYQLVLNGATNVGTPVAGNGGAITFGNQTAAGTYTVVGTSALPCTNNMSNAVTITVNPLPVITPTVVQPSTCVAADGSITLAISAATGPFSFAWTGTGVNPTAQNQTGLTVGNYSVTVTATGTTCSSTMSFTLLGPGGCFICPTVPNTSTNPTPATCIGSTVTLTSTALTNMGVTYGIQFVSFAAPTANPYTGGTVLTTVANGALTSGKTVATGTTTFATAGTYYIYSILNPTPIDPACRPSATTTLTINPTPTVNAVANQVVCNGANTTAVTFTGTPVGVVYNWTNNTTSIGLAASGTGNIASFVGINTTGAAVTATITVTPSYTAAGATCTGTPVTFTITVNPTPTVNTVANQVVCNNTSTTAVTFSGNAATAVYNWTNNTTSIGLAASGTGNIAAFTAVNTGTTPVIATVTVTPTFTNGAVTCTGTAKTFTITVNPTPNATIAYTGSPYCQSSGTATVTQTGTTGGTYTSTTGLTINATTGAVTLGTSTPGTYTVTYTIAAAGGCAAFSTTASITVTATPNATISYAGSPYCQNSGTAAVTQTGSTGGTYTSTTGLSINGTSGLITLGTSTPGTYTVTYTVAAAGGCAQYTTTTSVTVTATPNATISYAGSPYCGTGTATVTRTGTTGGTYSSTAGLVINATTGDVNLTTSTPGSYTVTYTVAAAGGCTAFTTTANIVINTFSVAPTGATTNVVTNCGPATGVVLTVTGGSLGAGGSWKWYTGSCGGTLVGTGASITVNVTGTTTYYVRAEGTCNTTTCASVTTTIYTQPTISIAAAPYTKLMPGWNTTLTATINPVAASNTIVWYKNGSAVTGANTNTLNVTVDDLGTYTARITTANLCTALSNAVTISDSATEKLFIYPNPNNGKFIIRFHTTAQNFGFLRTVLIYDGKGAIVYNKRIPITAPYSSMNINMTNNAKGIYTVVLADYLGKPLAEGKVVIQ